MLEMFLIKEERTTNITMHSAWNLIWRHLVHYVAFYFWPTFARGSSCKSYSSIPISPAYFPRKISPYIIILYLTFLNWGPTKVLFLFIFFTVFLTVFDFVSAECALFSFLTSAMTISCKCMSIEVVPWYLLIFSWQ